MNNLNKILVTGASGFIGEYLCKSLSKNRTVTGIVRSISKLSSLNNIQYLAVGDIASKKNWKKELSGIDCVVHCAGKAHVISKSAADNLESYRKHNVIATKYLAEQCAELGVKRLIFLSSVGVHGVFTNNFEKFTINDDLNPVENYALSKLEAERELFKISNKSGLEIVLLRLPLVYGRGAKGNFTKLLKLVQTKLPLPFKLIKNKRSFIGIDNLVDIITLCIDNPNVARKTFLVSDGVDLSTPELIKLIANSMGHKARFFSLPIILLKVLGIFIGKRKEINRLTGSLTVDSSYVREVLNWQPAVSVEEGIKRMIQDK